MLWPGWITGRAIVGPANRQKKIAATPVSPDFIMRSSLGFGWGG